MRGVKVLMLSPHHLLLLVALLADGGTAPVQPSTTSPDAGTAALPSSLKAPP